MAKIFRKIQTTNPELMKVQSQVESAINPVLKLPILDYVTHTVTLTTAGLQFNHLLNRQPQGWYIVDNTADARVWRTAWDEYTLSLDASATTTITIIVF